MSTQNATGRAMKDVVEEARVLMDATADVEGEQVAKARKRLAAALERGKAGGEATADSAADMVHTAVADLRALLGVARDRGVEMAGDVRDKAVEQAKAADGLVRAHPYHALGVAFGVGAILGIMVSHCCCRKGK